MEAKLEKAPPDPSGNLLEVRRLLEQACDEVVKPDYKDTRNLSYPLSGQFSRYLHEAPVGVVFYRDKQILYGNIEANQVLGAESPDKLQTLNLDAWIHEQDFDRNSKKPQSGSQKSITMTDVKVDRLDGQQIYISGAATLTEVEGIPAVQVTFWDSTTEKVQRQSLIENELRFRKLFESSPIPISINNGKGDYMQVNPALVEMSGYSEEELLSMSYMDITHPDDLQIDQNQTKKLFDQEIPYFQIEKRFKHKDGSTIWGNLSATIVRDEQGTPLYGIGMIENITKRKKSEEELRRNKKYLDNILESPTDLVVFSLNTHYEYLAFNSNHKKIMKAIWGVDIEVGISMLSVIGSEEDGKKAKANFDRVLSGEEFIVVEEYGDESLQRSYWEDFYHPIRDDENNVIGLTVFVKDITDRKIAEDTIRDSKRMLETINRNIREGIYRSSLESGLQYANNAFVEMFGYDSVEEVLAAGSPFLYNNPEKRGQLVRKLVQDGKLSNEEVEFKRKDGSVFFGLVSSTLYREDDETTFIDGAIRDITLQKIAEREVNEKEVMLSSINRNINEGIYRSTGTKGLVYVNEAFSEMFGYGNQEEVFAIDPNELYMDPEDRDRLSEMLKENPRISNFEVRFRKKNGQSFWGLMNAIRTQNVNGEIYYDGAIRDISSMKDIQEELEEAKTRAEEMNRLKTNFLANMSHEIRTPINGIIGLAELMDEEFSDHETLSEYTGMLKQSGLRLLNTITSILDLSKIEAQRMDVALSELSFHEAISQVIPSLHILAERKNLDFEYFNDAPNAIIRIDPYVLEQIINNLVGNAIKFTLKGKVSIQTGLTVVSKTDMVYCRITDTGIGISESFLPQIFSSFVQESHGIGRNFEGTGLGLSIVKRYLEMYGGSIHVESVKGEGSTFEFRLPVYQIRDK